MFFIVGVVVYGGVTKFLESIGEVTRIPVESKQPFKIQNLKIKLKQL